MRRFSGRGNRDRYHGLPSLARLRSELQTFKPLIFLFCLSVLGKTRSEDRAVHEMEIMDNNLPNHFNAIASLILDQRKKREKKRKEKKENKRNSDDPGRLRISELSNVHMHHSSRFTSTCHRATE